MPEPTTTATATRVADISSGPVSTGDPPPYTGPERRRSIRDWQDSIERRFVEVDRRFGEGSETMKALADGLADNTAATMRTEANTAELVSVFQSFKGAFQVFNMIGAAAKPLGYIVMCASAIWGAIIVFKTGGGHR